MEQFPLADLPYDVRKLVVEQVPAAESGAVRLTCREWRSIADGSSRLSGRLVLSAGHAGAAALDPNVLDRLARKLAPVVQEVCASEALRPGVLGALQHLPGLRSLTVRIRHGEYEQQQQAGLPLGQLPPGWLAAFPQLQQLKLDVDFLGSSAAAQLAFLPGLTSLDIGTFESEVPDGLWQALADMRSLQQLRLYVSAEDGNEPCFINGIAWAALAACTRLTKLSLDGKFLPHNGLAYAGADADGWYVLEDGISSVASLQSLTLTGLVPDDSDLWQHTGLRSLSITGSSRYGGLMPPSSDVRMPMLASVELREVGSDPVPGLFPALLTLTSIRSLTVSGNFDGDYHGWGAELHKLCQLSSLTLECPPTVERDEFFSCIALAESITHLTTLRYLSMTDLWLEALPPGPYLASLRTLLLPGNCLALVPPALADARRLEVLDLSEGQYLNPDVDKNEGTWLWGDDGVCSETELALLAQLPLRLVCTAGSAELFPPTALLTCLNRLPAAVIEDGVYSGKLNHLFSGGRWDDGIDAAAVGKARQAQLRRLEAALAAEDDGQA